MHLNRTDNAMIWYGLESRKFHKIVNATWIYLRPDYIEWQLVEHASRLKRKEKGALCVELDYKLSKDVYKLNYSRAYKLHLQCIAIYAHSAITEHGKELRAEAREKNGNVSLMEIVNATATIPRAVASLFKLFIL